jgi:hypothetical protein
MQRATVMTFYGLLLAGLIAVAALRGPWLDEFWSLFFAADGLTLPEAFRTRWVLDVHPPLFSFLSFSVGKLMPLSVHEGRLLNLIPVVLSGAFLWAFWIRNPAERAFIAIFAISVLSSAFSIQLFSEFRSYFSGMIAFAVLLVCLKSLVEEEAPTGADRLLLWSGLIVSLGACLNLHYITAVITTITVAATGVVLLARGLPRRCLALFATGFLLGLPLVGFALVQRAFLTTTVEDFWIHTTTIGALVVLLKVLSKTLAGAFLVFAAAGVTLLFPQRGDRDPSGPSDDVRASVLWLASAVVSFLVLLAINARVPIMQDRYLVPIAVLLIASASAYASSRIAGSRMLSSLLLANGVVTLAVVGLLIGSRGGWNGSARLVSRHVAECPTSRVFAVMLGEERVPNAPENRQLAFAAVAGHWGFPIRPVNDASAPSPSGACPDIVWAEHFHPSRPYSDDELGSVITSILPKFEPCQLSIETVGSGIVALAERCGR